MQNASVIIHLAKVDHLFEAIDMIDKFDYNRLPFVHEERCTLSSIFKLKRSLLSKVKLDMSELFLPILRVILYDLLFKSNEKLVSVEPSC